MSTYNSYRTFRRSCMNLETVRDYDWRKARDIFASYPHVQQIHFATPYENTQRNRYVPEPLSAIYVKSTTGQYGKSSRLRVSVNPYLMGAPSR